MHSVAIMVSGVINVQKCLLDNSDLIDQIWDFSRIPHQNYSADGCD